MRAWWHFRSNRDSETDELPLPNGHIRVSEQRLHDVLLLERQSSKREHLKTRAWVLIMTAPAWATALASLSTQITGLSGGATIGAIGVGGVVYWRGARGG